MKKIEYKSGDIIGKCIFLNEINPINNKRRAEFKCECGNTFNAQINNVKSLSYVSCGCKKTERVKDMNKTHGLSLINGKKRPEYAIYNTMIQRCHNENDKNYKWYGGRGIRVCERWRSSFSNFIEDIGFRPSKELTIDRINNEMGYSKDNCRWATMKEQSKNRRSNINYKQF